MRCNDMWPMACGGLLLACLAAPGCGKSSSSPASVAKQDSPPPAAKSTPSSSLSPSATGETANTDAGGSVRDTREDEGIPPESTPPASTPPASTTPSPDAAHSDSAPSPPDTAEATSGAKPESDPATGAVSAEPEHSDDSAPPSTSANASSGSPPAPPAGSRRLLLFGPRGPVVIELLLRVDGQPFDEPFQRLVEEILQAADTDGDGIPTWEELTSSRDFRYGQYGNQPLNSLAERMEVQRNYDGGDGRVDANEVIRFLNANRDGSGAFVLRSSNQYREDNQTRSLVRQLLDADEDGRLSEREIAAAPVRLRTRDNDEDDILFLDDFQPASNLAPQQLAGMNAPRRAKRYGPDAAMLLDPRMDGASLLLFLQELYTFGGAVGPEPFSLAPAIFTQLDADGSRVLSASELAGWLDEAPPHLRVAAHFGTSPDSGDAAPRLELLDLHEDLRARAPAIRRSPGRLAITLPEMELLVTINDASPRTNDQQVAQAQLRQLDADGNGYLDESEFTATGTPAGLPFEGVDTDGDGKVPLNELVEALRRRQAVARNQLRGYAADQQDALYTALDQDNDGRLTTREIDGVSERLRALDTSGDGTLSPYEIPGSMVVVLSRGTTGMNTPDAAYVAPRPAYPEDVPAWFPPMDTNRDGEVSRLEFLGTQDLFDQLDSDSDGFLDASEAADVTERGSKP